MIAAGEDALQLRVVQPAGKPKMDVADFLNGLGRTIEEGDRFGE